MSEYDFILDNLRFSYSSVSSFDTCPGGFKLAYIDAEERIGNAFSDFGNLVHKVLELYFKGELELFELAQYYEQHYAEYIQNPFPSYPAGMAEGYFKSGLEFFENFSFDKSLYDIVFIEDYINSVFNKVSLTIKPDLILREIESGDFLLIDYKTAKMKSGKDYKEQIDGYKKQFLLYCYFLYQEKDIIVKKLKIWFIRDNKEIVIDVKVEDIMNTMEWFEQTVLKIKQETEWKFNNTKENSYFCEQICGTRLSCPMMKKFDK